MALENVSTLRPGLLVSLKTSVTGNVKYLKSVIENDHVTSTGEKVAVWETTRTIADPDEHERAAKARNAAGHCIRAVCANSAFGLLCAEDRADKLEAAIKEARKIADDFNKSASITNVAVYVVCGRVEQSDVEAVRAINSEVRDLLAEMQDGLRNLDVKAVRAAATKAKGLGQMLSDDASEKVKIAIEAARKSARNIVKAGEGATVEIDNETIKVLRQQSVAFLDLSDDDKVELPKADTGPTLDLSGYYSDENRDAMFPQSPVK